MNYTTTTNGAKQYTTSNDECVDLFSKIGSRFLYFFFCEAAGAATAATALFCLLLIVIFFLLFAYWYNIFRWKIKGNYQLVRETDTSLCQDHAKKSINTLAQIQRPMSPQNVNII